MFFDGFSFLKKYGTPCIPLKNLVANKIIIKTVNYDLMKGYNVSSFFQKTWN